MRGCRVTRTGGDRIVEMWGFEKDGDTLLAGVEEALRLRRKAEGMP